MRILAALLLVGILGCTPEQHDASADKAEQTKEIVDGIRAAIGSEVGKTVTAVVSTLPVPGAQLVPVAREKLEWGLGILSVALTAFAGWQSKRAAEERSKKKAYKLHSTKAELDAANKVIYGDAFCSELSK